MSCLGACGQAPLLVLDGALALRLPIADPAALEARLDCLGLPRSPGPQAPGAKEPGAWGPELVLAGER